MVDGKHFPVLVRDDFKPALAHDGVVHVSELRAFADGAGFVELDLYACAVSHPGDLADGTDCVSADDYRVFGLQRAQFVKIDIGLVGYVLVRLVHAVRDTRK